MLKARDQDAVVSKAEAEFYRAQQVKRPVPQGFRRARFDLSQRPNSSHDDYGG
jgi:hypothetical protein